LSGSGSKAPAPTAATATAPAPAAAPAAAAAPPEAALPELTPQQLLKEASSAMHENRLVAPAGNNAFEYYERLLEKEPNNVTAKDALRETFPIVIGVPEQEINAGNLDEATRVINLLAKADPNNYTLTILRSKLDAKKKQTDREQAQQAAIAAAAAARQAPAAASAAAPPPAPSAAPREAPPAETAAAPAASSAPPAATAARPAPATGGAATPAVAAAGGDSHGAEILKTPPPDYPPDAARKREQGWVEVEFTVSPDGSVTNASVVNAQPARVFNSSALRAVERWTFKPRMENGKAVEEKMRRRIEFKL
jgi:protein TonB